MVATYNALYQEQQMAAQIEADKLSQGFAKLERVYNRRDARTVLRAFKLWQRRSAEQGGSVQLFKQEKLAHERRHAAALVIVVALTRWRCRRRHKAEAARRAYEAAESLKAQQESVAELLSLERLRHSATYICAHLLCRHQGR